MIIKSILDTDAYKLFMCQCVLEHYPNADVEYRFIDRGRKIKVDNPKGQDFLDALRFEVDSMAKLAMSRDELEFVKTSVPCMKNWFLDFLNNYRYNPSEVFINADENGYLQIRIKGKWHSTMFWEVPLMALISELYFKIIDTNWEDDDQQQMAAATAKAIELDQNNCLFSEFGTRRRRSAKVQRLVTSMLAQVNSCVGTSNIMLAKELGIKPIGTMAHELTMGISALEGLRHANRFMMDKWTATYGSDLGTVLTDTFTTDVFLKDFSNLHARLFDSARHDSGDPFEYVDKIVAHYEKCQIRTISKAIIFSNALDVKKCIEINKYCEGKILARFGIGTHFSNHFPGSPALNIVIKLYSVNGIPVVKLSDDLDKATGDKDAVRVAKWTFFNTPLDNLGIANFKL